MIKNRKINLRTPLDDRINGAHERVRCPVCVKNKTTIMLKKTKNNNR